MPVKGRTAPFTPAVIMKLQRVKVVLAEEYFCFVLVRATVAAQVASSHINSHRRPPRKNLPSTALHLDTFTLSPFLIANGGVLETSPIGSSGSY